MLSANSVPCHNENNRCSLARRQLFEREKIISFVFCVTHAVCASTTDSFDSFYNLRACESIEPVESNRIESDERCRWIVPFFSDVYDKIPPTRFTKKRSNLLALAIPISDKIRIDASTFAQNLALNATAIRQVLPWDPGTGTMFFSILIVSCISSLSKTEEAASLFVVVTQH